MKTYGNLNGNKKVALAAYKEAVNAYRANITQENIKGDVEKFNFL